MRLKLIKFASVKSTNDEAFKLIKKNKIKPSILVATKQTKGRGTMGKKWISKNGNLFITIFFEFNIKKIKCYFFLLTKNPLRLKVIKVL